MTRLDFARPAYNRRRSYRALGHLAKFAAKGTGVAHVGRSLVSHLTCRLALRSIIRCKNNKRIVVETKLFHCVDDLPNVMIAFHKLVTVLPNLRLARKLL